MKRNFFFPLTLLFITYSIISCNKNQQIENTNETVSSKASTSALVAQTTLTGKMVFHRYSTYGAAAQMFIYNFNSNLLTNISANWNLHNPINGHFNFNGTQLVFMAEAVPNGKWDIYLWTVGATTIPVNLTATDGSRDEDPKFSPNGYRICFKQTNASGVSNLKTMDLSGIITNQVTNNTTETSMPYYSDDATALVYARGAGNTSDIYMQNINGTNNRALATVKNVQEYYPIVLGPTSFIYSRWYSSSNQHDQVYMGYFNGAAATRLPFNTSTADYSDAYPCITDYLLLSCDKAGGSGAYDLYLANIKTGTISSLSNYNTQINSTLNELGVAYSAQ